MFVVLKPRWPRCVRDLSESSVSEFVTHIWPIPMPMVCNDIPCDIPERDPPCMYIRTL